MSGINNSVSQQIKNAVVSGCSNCNKQLNGETKTSTFVADITDEGNIHICNAIAYIYRMDGIVWEQWKHNLRHDQEDKDLNADILEDSFAMCNVCVSLVSDAYKALKQLESLTHQASLIFKVQSSCERKLKNRKQIVRSEAPVSKLMSSVSSLEDDSLFDAFNFGEQKLLSPGEEDFFAKECKYESAENLFEAENLSVEESLQNENQSPESSAMEKTLRSSKQLTVKIERIPEEELICYNKSKLANSAVQEKSNKRRKKATSANSAHSDAASKNNTKSLNSLSPGTEKVTSALKRKTKPMLKLQHERVVKNKYSSKNNQTKIPKATPKDNRKFKCKICGKLFLHYNRLHSSHMPIHFQNFPCQKCDRKFYKKHDLRRHMLVVHNEGTEDELNKMKRACEVCGKLIKSYNMKLHMKNNHGPRETFKCNKCDKVYITKIAYDEHIVTHTENFTPYLCNHCGATFTDKRTLTMHEKGHSRHTEDKKFSCDICPKTFFYKFALRNHQTAHSNERKFVCDECGTSFKYKAHFLRHQKIHKEIADKGEYSFKCKYCAKRFKNSDILSKHLKGHENAFECSFCGKRHACPWALKRHENLHRNNPDYQPRKTKTWISDLPSQLSNSTSTNASEQK